MYAENRSSLVYILYESKSWEVMTLPLDLFYYGTWTKVRLSLSGIQVGTGPQTPDPVNTKGKYGDQTICNVPRQVETMMHVIYIILFNCYVIVRKSEKFFFMKRTPC